MAARDSLRKFAIEGVKATVIQDSVKLPLLKSSEVSLWKEIEVALSKMY